MEKSRIEPDDEEVARFVEQHPHGAPTREIAQHFNLTHQRIQKIEQQALIKLGRLLADLQVHDLTDI